MKRREFIAGTAGLIGSVLPVIGRAQNKPCPPPALQISGGSSLSTVCAAPPATGSPAWMSGKSINEWFEIPSTSLSSVEPKLDSLQRGFTGPRSKIDAWCGAALKREGSVYMLGACGGHADYSGNEVDAIQLNTDAPNWVELRGPSTSDALVNSSECYLDRRRSATHTYYCQQFSELTDSLVVMPAPGMGSSALPAPPDNWPYKSKRPMAFSLVAKDWLPPETYGEMALASGSDFTACLAATHAGTGDIYYARNYDNGRLWRFSPKSGVVDVAGAAWHQNYAGAAIDPSRNRMLIVGDYSGSMAPRVLDLNKGVTESVSFGGLGADALKMSGYPGVVFDDANDRYLVFRNTNPISTYVVNAANWQVSQLSTSGSPAARVNGIHNSVQYVPELEGVVIANSYSGNLYFMRVA